jgi:hypothetical protein
VRGCVAEVGLDPAAWHDLFGAVATASAALLGLFIVAISLHLRVVEEHAVVHNQARVALLLLALILALSVTALIPGLTSQWLGAELLAITLGSSVVYVNGLRRARRDRIPIPAGVWQRSILVAALQILNLAASTSLLARRGPGLYLLAPMLVANLPMSVFLAWRVILSPEGRRLDG